MPRTLARSFQENSVGETSEWYTPRDLARGSGDGRDTGRLVSPRALPAGPGRLRAWSDIGLRYPSWTPDQMARLEQAGRHKGDDPSMKGDVPAGWRGRMTSTRATCRAFRSMRRSNAAGEPQGGADIRRAR